MGNDNKDIFAPGQNKMRLDDEDDDQRENCLGEGGRQRGEILNNVLLLLRPERERERHVMKANYTVGRGRVATAPRISVDYRLADALPTIAGRWLRGNSVGLGSSVISGAIEGEEEAANRISSHHSSPESRKQ